LRESKEQLDAAKTQAESANRAKSVFISQMSHELRTPLNGILGFAQLLRRDANPTAERTRECLSVIERSGEHLLKLVNELLDLAKIEAGKLELTPGRLDLRELVEHVASLTRVRAASAGLSFNVVVGPSAFQPVMADERVLRQILLNLLGNAIKFTDAGGQVTLRMHAEPSGTDSMRVRFIVADSGIGIEETERARIFEPFHRVVHPNRAVEGTGLGLTITQRLIAAMQGRLSVTSERGSGSTFEVDVTLALAPQVQVTSAAVADIAGYEGPVRAVLVADDDRDNRRLVCALLESNGFRVAAASNGEDALAKLEALRPDLVLTDLVMPALDGIGLVRSLRSDPRTSALPVIAMSASASDVTREEALQAGCSCFLAKPLNLTALLEAIGAQLGLQWRHRVSAAPAASPVHIHSEPGTFHLGPELASELQHLARQGDVITLVSRMDECLSSDESAQAFCSEIRALASRYDIRAIRRALAPGAE
jgi:CheY-like chemotaxis protein/nitrogen-specific signal transduction histidine kinase